MTKLICNVCGHCWVPRTENPKECPKCKSYKWNRSVEGKSKKQTAKHIMVSKESDIDVGDLLKSKLERRRM